MKNKQYMKKNAGITLIVLVVTIVILLILVGVTISSFTGDDGLVNETKKTKNNIEDLQNKKMHGMHFFFLTKLTIFILIFQIIY